MICNNNLGPGGADEGGGRAKSTPPGLIRFLGTRNRRFTPTATHRIAPSGRCGGNTVPHFQSDPSTSLPTLAHGNALGDPGDAPLRMTGSRGCSFGMKYAARL